MIYQKHMLSHNIIKLKTSSSLNVIKKMKSFATKLNYEFNNKNKISV